MPETQRDCGHSQDHLFGSYDEDGPRDDTEAPRDCRSSEPGQRALLAGEALALRGALRVELLVLRQHLAAPRRWAGRLLSPLAFQVVKLSLTYRSSEQKGHSLNFLPLVPDGGATKSPGKFSEPYHLVEGDVVTRFPQ